MLHRLFSSFRNIFSRAEVDGDLDAELRAHVQLLTDEKVAAGMSTDAARRQSLLELGGLEQVKEEVRGVRAGMWLEQLWQDLRFGLRTLRKSPGFASLAILTIALGIGANTAMFSVIEGVLLQKPPFSDPDRVVVVLQKQSNGNANIFSTPDFLEWKGEDTPVSQMAAGRTDSVVFGTGEQAQLITGWRLSSEAFSVLGVTPVIGRPFTPEEDKTGAGNVVLLSDAFWKKNFNADRNILGTKVNLDGAPYTVIGVLPPRFQIFDPTESFWT